jgi:hypothetical protein
MEVEHKRATRILDSFGQFGCVLESIHPIPGVDPNPEPETGPTVPHKNGKGVIRLISVQIHTSLPFHL